MHYQKLLLKSVFSFLLTLVYSISHGQDPTGDVPPDPGLEHLVVNKAQDMNFGAFSVNADGGMITLSNTGLRSATGGAILLNMGYIFHQCIFDITTPEGTIVSITNGPDVTLTGSSGGLIALKLGSSSPASPFASTIAPPGTTAVHIGGTLTIGGGASAGVYSGTFNVTFNYQ